MQPPPHRRRSRHCAQAFSHALRSDTPNVFKQHSPFLHSSLTHTATALYSYAIFKHRSVVPPRMGEG